MKLEIHSALAVLLLAGATLAGGHSRASISTTVASIRSNVVHESVDVSSHPAHNTTPTEETSQTTAERSDVFTSAETSLGQQTGQGSAGTSDFTPIGPLLHSPTNELPASTTTSPKPDPKPTSPPAPSSPSTARLSPAGPTHREFPSQLKVGDEEFMGHRSRSNLDPLLAGLLCIFIITTAAVFVVLFLKFRQRTNNPEFHRLQDLPMDDLMEDTPLSRYSY